MKGSIISAASIALTLLMIVSGCTGNTDNENPYVSSASSAGASAAHSADDQTAQGSDPRKLTPVAESQKSAPEAPQQRPTSKNGSEPQTPDFSYDESSCSSWQLAYVALLQEIITRETPVRTADSNGRSDENGDQLSSSYCLYDVDKDGIPEIFIRFGNCEANYRTEVYTCRNGSVLSLGEYPSGHSCLYTFPNENAVLLSWGYMGYAEMDKIGISNNALVFKEILTEDISQNPEANYTAADKIVPGSVYLPEFRTALNLPQYAPLTLPIYDYGKTGSNANNLNATDDSGKKAINEVLAGTRKLYGVSGDGYGGDTGWMSFSEYRRPGGVDQYAKQPLQLRKTGWVDFNNDGLAECILVLGEKSGNAGSSDKYVILCEQNGVVYAYCINYSCDYEVYQDGVFAGESDWAFGISFYKNQCYQYGKFHDPSKDSIIWDTYNQ